VLHLCHHLLLRQLAQQLCALQPVGQGRRLALLWRRCCSGLLLLCWRRHAQAVCVRLPPQREAGRVQHHA
jgi:hypothetical protein